MKKKQKVSVQKKKFKEHDEVLKTINNTDIKIEDVQEIKSKVTDNYYYSIACPKCGRNRPLDIAILAPCPGVYNHATGRSMGGCGHSKFMKKDMLEKIEQQKQEHLKRIQAWVQENKKSKEKEVKEMPIVNKKKVEVKKPIKKAAVKAPAKKVVTKEPTVEKKMNIRQTILEMYKKGEPNSAIAEVVQRNNAYVSITISKAKKQGLVE